MKCLCKAEMDKEEYVDWCPNCGRIYIRDKGFKEPKFLSKMRGWKNLIRERLGG